MATWARAAYDGHYSARYGIIYEVRTAGAIIQRHLHPNKQCDTAVGTRRYIHYDVTLISFSPRAHLILSFMTF